MESNYSEPRVFEKWLFFSERLGLKKSITDVGGRHGTQRPGKKPRAWRGSETHGGRKKSRFHEMPLREQWSTVEKAILVKDDLQNVPVMEEDNIWDYLDGDTRVEMEEFRARRAGKQPQGGGGWPQTAARSP